MCSANGEDRCGLYACRKGVIKQASRSACAVCGVKGGRHHCMACSTEGGGGQVWHAASMHGNMRDAL